jgi:hypothetical protein
MPLPELKVISFDHLVLKCADVDRALAFSIGAHLTPHTHWHHPLTNCPVRLRSFCCFRQGFHVHDSKAAVLIQSGGEDFVLGLQFNVRSRVH